MATMSLPNVVSHLRNRLSPNKSYDCEECPVCWSDMPSNPKVLPCGHKFCRKCIKDLSKYQEDREADACCPMCRGPLKRACAKRLWAEAKMHEQEGQDYYRLHQVEVSISAGHRLVTEAQREYRLAVKRLEECFVVLKMDHERAISKHSSRRKVGFSSPARRDSKHRQQEMRVLCKLIEVVPMARYEDGEERTIQLLRSALAKTDSPMPHLNLKLAKLLHRQFDEDLLDEVIDEYERILQIAKENRGMAGRQAKKMQGQAHYGLARCYHQMLNYRQACEQYRACERFNALKDHGLAAECHYKIGNYIQAMDYASMQLRKESTRPTIETLLLMAKICKAYFMSIRYRGIDTLDYQWRCETYRRCVRHAQLLAVQEHHYEECCKHAKLLHHLIYPTTHKKRMIIPSYSIVSPTSSVKDNDSNCDDNDDLETEECDTEASVEL